MSTNIQQICGWFDVSPRIGGRSAAGRRSAPLPPAPGQILWITGASGSGKSSLLRQLHRRCRSGWLNVHRITLPPRPIIDGFGDLALQEVLGLLCRLGLGEVWTWLKTPGQLSAGQQFRLRLAHAMHAASRHSDPVIVCDEFAAGLDPVAAAVAARCLRRFITPTSPIRAILAGSRDDLRRAMKPDRVIECDFQSWRT